MQAIDRSLRIRLDKDFKSSANPRLSVTARRDARQRVVDISSFLNILGVPPEVKTSEDFNSLPSGTVFIDPEGLERRKP